MKAATLLWPASIWAIGHEAQCCHTRAECCATPEPQRAADAIRLSPGFHAKPLRFARRATGLRRRVKYPLAWQPGRIARVRSLIVLLPVALGQQRYLGL